MIFPKMMAAGKAETVDFKRKNKKEIKIRTGYLYLLWAVTFPGGIYSECGNAGRRSDYCENSGIGPGVGAESIELYQCGTGVKRFYYQYKAVRNCYSKKR